MDNLSHTSSRAEVFQNTFVAKVYGWMSVALALTGFTALWVASTPTITNAIINNQILFWGLFIGELVLVFAISGAIQRISASTALFLFLLYSVLNGFTMSFIFLVYTATSIATTFFITAGTFAIMSIYGFMTKKDLTKVGSLLFMILIGVIIASVVNLFLKSTMLNWIITIAGIIVFVGLIAYDTQKIRQMSQADFDQETGKKLSVLGALTIYLDFINLFLLLLNLFGGSRRD